jgi:hypothetical protein
MHRSGHDSAVLSSPSWSHTVLHPVMALCKEPLDVKHIGADYDLHNCGPQFG